LGKTHLGILVNGHEDLLNNLHRLLPVHVCVELLAGNTTSGVDTVPSCNEGLVPIKYTL